MLYSARRKNRYALPGISFRRSGYRNHDEYNVIHRVWKISDPAVIAAAQDQIRDQKLIIADGHHRYETALAYRNERQIRIRFQHSPRAPRLRHDDLCRYGSSRHRDPAHTPRSFFGLSPATIVSFPNDVLRFFKVEDVDPGIDATRAAAILQQAGIVGSLT